MHSAARFIENASHLLQHPSNALHHAARLMRHPSNALRHAARLMGHRARLKTYQKIKFTHPSNRIFPRKERKDYASIHI